MRKLTLREWEEKYIAGEVKRFNEKNHMFNRPGWDATINPLMESWDFTGPVRETKGYRLEDQALRWAASRGTLMTLFNTYKPNPSPAAESVRHMLSRAPVVGRYVVPEGLKIDVTDKGQVTRMIKKAAIWFGADMVGIYRLDRRWVYSHTYQGQPYMGQKGTLAEGESLPQEIPESFQYVIVMGFEMDYDLMKYMPTYIANVATRMGYSRMAITNNYMTNFINNIGFKAMDCSINTVALSIPMAMQAGLGEIARNGLLVTPRYGPRVRLNNVITDLPLEEDAPVEFGVTEFCTSCEVCADKCPSQSIMHGERTSKARNISNIEGTIKWPVNAETCRMHWARGQTPCAVCITVCPYNKPDTLFHRLVRWCTDHARWGDALYVKADGWMGYGRTKKAERFWEEWGPKKGT